MPHQPPPCDVRAQCRKRVILGPQSTASSSFRRERSGDGLPGLSSVNEDVRNIQNDNYIGAGPLIEIRCIVYAARKASAGLPAVTTSNWPTVSRPKSNGMKAPIATTTNIVPKKIVGEPVNGS